jgi:hypothetical protein
MGIIDQFRKNKEEKIDKVKPAPPEGHSVPEIMQDKKSSVLFGELLKKNGLTDLGHRLREGKLDPGDMAVLDKHRKEFSEMLVESEKTREFLTEENIISLARNHPDFKQVIDVSTPEKVAKAIGSQLEFLFINDRNRFNEVVSAMKDLEKYGGGKFKENEKKIEKFCSDNGISQEEYLGIVAIKNGSERNLAMAKLAKSKYGKFKRVVNWVTHGKYAKDNTGDIFSALKDSEKTMNSSIKRLDGLHREIADALFLSLTQDESMRHALSRELVGEKAEEDERIGWKDAKGQTIDEDKWKKEWEICKREKDYRRSSMVEQEGIKDTFLQEQKDAHKKKNANKGFWATIFEDFIEKLINDKRSQLK